MRWLMWVALGVLGCDGESNRVGEAPDMDRPDASGTDAGVADMAPDPPVEDPPALDVEQALVRVDPFIGSGGFGFNYAAQTPAAQVPLGMVRLGPDTTRNGAHPGFHHFSGYHHDDPQARGFSHTHFVGTGIVDYGNVRVLPWRALEDGVEPGRLFTAMDKQTEHAEPGLYRVTLPDQDTEVTLTATTRAGLHRYAFGAGGRVHILLDAAASAADRGVESAQVQFNGAAIEGHVVYRGPLTGRTRPFTLHFSALASQTPSETFVWGPEGIVPGAQTADGDVAGGGLAFDVDAGDQIELRVGISYIDLEQARQNRAEVEDRTVEEVAAAARAAWADLLGRVRIGGGTEAEQRMFYTALYHTFTMPTRLDEGGRYRGLDGEVHATDGPYYTDLSLWDTFRTLHPWFVLIAPEVQRDCLRSLLYMARDGGYVPRWPAGLSYGSSMIGTSADMLFAGSALKGIDGIDYDAAFDALWVTASAPTPPGAPFSGRRGIAAYLEHGYIPQEVQDGSVSRTLEFAYSDWALANLADHLGRPEADALRQRGANFRHIFDAEQGFFAPRDAEGVFEAVQLNRIYMTDGPYVEGSPRHWRFSALQDPEGLAGLHGGPEGFAAVLGDYFTRSGLGEGLLNHAAPDLHYWHGNEPTLHTVYLWHAAGDWHTGADWLRAIQTRAYADTPAGMPGNDDGGTLSSWYLFSALGLYPVAGSDQYLTGAPLFPYAEIDTAAGPLIIRAPGASVEGRYVRSVRLGGNVMPDWRLSHDSLLSARRLDFEMSPTR